MPKYNIIYTSLHHDTYLWNGSSLDKLAKTGQDVLRFSGKDFDEDKVADAIHDCKAAAKRLFPGDDGLKVEKVEIKISE